MRASAEAVVPGVRLVERTEDLGAIFEPEVSLAALVRTVPAAIRADLADSKRTRFVEEVRLDDDVIGLLERWLGGRRLAEDVAAWAELVGVVTGAPAVGVRLQWAARPMCPRFHVDQVTLRAVCVYEGAGTEYLADADVDRSKLGHGSDGQPDEVSGLIRPGAPIHRLPTGAVALFKGEAWPAQRGRALVHRSSSDPGPRWVLTLDPLVDGA